MCVEFDNGWEKDSDIKMAGRILTATVSFSRDEKVVDIASL